MGTNLLLNGFYYPLAQSMHLGRTPIERIIDSRSITLFRDKRGRAIAVDSECPHRGSNLSRGTVIDGCLVCPYHAWRFDDQGRCVHVPSHPDRPIPNRSTIRTYPVIEQQGLIWMCPTPSVPLRPPPRFPVADNPSLRRFSIERVVTGPFDWWVENFMDISHVPFVHDDSFGGKHPCVETYPVTRWDNELGYRGRVVVEYHYGLMARLIHGTLRPYTEDLQFEVTLPGNVQVTIDMSGGRKQALALLATPIDDNTTRVMIIVWRNYLKRLPFADHIGRVFTHRILREDEGIVKHCIKPLRQSHQAVMASDRTAMELHRLLRIWRARQANPNGDKQ